MIQSKPIFGLVSYSLVSPLVTSLQGSFDLICPLKLQKTFTFVNGKKFLHIICKCTSFAILTFVIIEEMASACLQKINIHLPISTLARDDLPTPVAPKITNLGFGYDLLSINSC